MVLHLTQRKQNAKNLNPIHKPTLRTSFTLTKLGEKAT